MSRIRGRNTRPERILRRALRAGNIKLRSSSKTPVGFADVVISNRYAPVAVFIDGCFWHGCPDHYVPPRSRIDFWAAKLLENVVRDQRQTLGLDASGWRVIRLWEHEVFEELDRSVRRVADAMRPRVPRRRASWRVLRIEWRDEERLQERRCMQDLRDPLRVRVEERPRQTKKARAPGSP